AVFTAFGVLREVDCDFAPPRLCCVGVAHDRRAGFPAAIVSGRRCQPAVGGVSRELEAAPVALLRSGQSAARGCPLRLHRPHQQPGQDGAGCLPRKARHRHRRVVRAIGRRAGERLRRRVRVEVSAGRHSHRDQDPRSPSGRDSRPHD
ncbi:unnamed protein product, partial [Ectocarpus fasciculatus]